MELGIILKNDELVVDSLTVAEVFEKEHRRILKDIRKIEEYFDTININQDKRMTLPNVNYGQQRIQKKC
ncbi:TPA: Rha family transcriptional regulator [Streptococcus suis]